MKILHINNYISGGGAETVFSLSINATANDNFTGYVPQNNSIQTGSIVFNSWENENSFLGVINYIFSRKNYILLMDFLEKNNINIIHLHGFFSVISPSILLAIKKFKAKTNVKVVQTLHDFHLNCPNSSLYNFNDKLICNKCIGLNFKYHIFLDNCDRRGWFYSIIKGLRSIVSNNILHHKILIDAFIAPSNFLFSKLVEEKIEANRIHIIRNPGKLKQKQIENKKENIICYFGRFSREKNLNFLIESFNRWKRISKNNFRLLLIGEGEERSILKSIAGNSEFAGSIIFKDFLPQDALFNEICNAKYFCLTSSCYENSPMAIIEALSLNIIPIVPNLGGMAESITELFKIGRTYQPGDYENWIATMTELESVYEVECSKFSTLQDQIAGPETYKFELGNLYNQIISA